MIARAWGAEPAEHHRDGVELEVAPHVAGGHVEDAAELLAVVRPRLATARALCHRNAKPSMEEAELDRAHGVIGATFAGRGEAHEPCRQETDHGQVDVSRVAHERARAQAGVIQYIDNEPAAMSR